MEVEYQLQISKPCEAVYVFIPLCVPTNKDLVFIFRHNPTILFNICILPCEEKVRLCYRCTTWWNNLIIKSPQSHLKESPEISGSFCTLYINCDALQWCCWLLNEVFLFNSLCTSKTWLHFYLWTICSPPKHREDYGQPRDRWGVKRFREIKRITGNMHGTNITLKKYKGNQMAQIH